jgi:hypothetical protein
MIVGSRITKVEATREKEGAGKGLKVDINIRDVTVKGEEVKISYDFSAEYIEGIGKIGISGEIVDRAGKKVADEVKKEWKEKNDLPQEYKIGTLNSINYIASVEGVLVAKIVRLAPPIAPPRIRKK